MVLKATTPYILCTHNYGWNKGSRENWIERSRESVGKITDSDRRVSLFTAIAVFLCLKCASLECNEIIFYNCLKLLNNGNFI